MRDLEGKVAVITGGASGIGKAMAERFARAGMHLTLVDIEEAPLESTAEALRESGCEVLTQQVDVADAEAMDGLAQNVFDRFGTLHLLCNNAGVAAAGPIWELTTEDWEFTMRPNLWGVIHGVRVFGPRLVEQDCGHIVNTASMAGLVSLPGMGAYNLTKQGVVAFSETLFGDLQNAQSKVGVSVLCPAFVQTKIWDSERNRPEHLQSDRTPEFEARQSAGREILKTVIENAMPAEAVADRVHTAVLENQLYILTHEGTIPALEKRIGHIVKGENPTPNISEIGSLHR